MLGRLQLNKLQKGKVAVHILQALFIFIGLCILITILTEGGHNDGRVFWYLVLCFITVPAMIYLVMTPMWARAVRFANVFAMLGVDAVYTIFWFSAFIALAAFNNNGKDQGAKDRNIGGQGNCTTYAYGRIRKCELANAAVGFGVVIFLLWLVTTCISIYFLLRWRKGDPLPWETAIPKTYQEPTSIDSHTKDAWSSDVHEPVDQGSDDGRTTPRADGYGDDDSMLLHGTETEDGRHPGKPWDPLSNNHGYAAPMPEERTYQNPHHYAPPSVVSPSVYSPQGGGYDSYQPGNPVFNSSGR